MKNIIINSIETKRLIYKWPSWDLVYEWEDILKDRLNIDFRYQRKSIRFVNRFLRYLPLNRAFSNNSKYCSLIFEMASKTVNSSSNIKNKIPCIIDFYLSDDELKDFEKAYSENPFLLISSAQVYYYLKRKNFKKEIYHFPLSISDKYCIDRNTNYKKKYDLVLMGRTNKVLKGYLDKYINENDDFVYVYRILKGDVFNYYTSKGELIGNVNTREDYINLMRQARIGLYSTPCIDDDEKKSNGFNQVTPRFLELISCCCHIIARYKENEDTDYYGIKDISPNITNYNEFKERMDFCRHNDVDIIKYSRYLQNHYTSTRATLLNKILNIHNKL